ncbi:MAG: hypothetical protein M1832_002462 [Thelocarpon impressellum]|nr:MAG: hypothetical protein M1832_002462 [Thelocarpon impressellum]
MYAAAIMMALLGASALAPARASPVSAGNATATTTNACASVSALSAALAQASARSIRVPASLAHDCLQSVPMDRRNATRLVNSYQQFYQFQSSLAFIKILRPHNVGKGVYKGEYDFQLALYEVVVRVRDDHTSYLPDLLGGAFLFPIPVHLSSVSRDGVELPQIYVPGDVYPKRNQSSPRYLEELASKERGQDHDSNYNAVLTDLITLGLPGWAGGSAVLNAYHGPTTSLKFDNGTTRIFDNSARVVGDLTGVDSGTALYSRFCVSKPPASTPDGTEVTKQSRLPSPFGYPAAVARHSSNAIAGYFLDGNHSDVAVLRIDNFSPWIDSRDILAGMQEFQKVVIDFLARCRTDGKTRLIVDVQSNSGGVPDAEYDLFKQLFPTTHPYEASVTRATPAIKAITQSSHEIYQGKLGPDGTVSSDDIWLWLNPFQIFQLIAADGTNFGSLDSYLGGAELNSDKFTALAQDNLTTPADGRLFGINITGYGRPAGYSEPPFAVENVIVLSNGICASACDSFLEQTWTELWMNFVVVGGRPRHAPMTAAGSTKGGNILAYYWLNETIAGIKSALSGAPDKLKAFTDVVSLDMYALERASNGSYPTINARSIIRHHDGSGVPTHFLYDEAQCRMFLTAWDLFSPVGLWKRVADAAFRNASVCSPTKPTSNGAGVPLVRRARPGHPSGKDAISGASNSTALAARSAQPP